LHLSQIAFDTDTLLLKLIFYEMQSVNFVDGISTWQCCN